MIIIMAFASPALMPLAYEDTKTISARAQSLMACNASMAEGVDALYLNPANLGNAGTINVQATLKSPLLGYFPSVTGSIGMLIPVGKGVGFAFTGDASWDTGYYTEYAGRLGFGFDLGNLIPGFSAGFSLGGNGFLLNYSELGGLYALNTNALTLTVNASVAYSPAQGIRGAITIENIQFLALFDASLPAFLRSSAALPVTITLSQSFPIVTEHTLMLGITYQFPTIEGDLYEVVLGYTWAVLPYLLDINAAVKSINVIKAGAVSFGTVVYPFPGMQISAGWIINITAPNILGDMYVSTVFSF